MGKDNIAWVEQSAGEADSMSPLALSGRPFAALPAASAAGSRNDLSSIRGMEVLT